MAEAVRNIPPSADPLAPYTEQPETSFPALRPRYAYGILMAVLTSIMWSLLPILIKIAVGGLSPSFVATFRLGFGAIFLFVALAAWGLKPLLILRHPPLAAIGAGVMLSLNYYFFIAGTELAGASSSGILIQSGPLFLLLIGVFWWKERLTQSQVLGVIVAVCGFLVFYYDRQGLVELKSSHFLGSAFLIFGGFVWSFFAVFHKRASLRENSQRVNLLVFTSAFLCLLPFARFPETTSVSTPALTAAVLLGCITLLAYGCFAEALKYAPASHVSLIVALYPPFTLLMLKALERSSLNLLPAEAISAVGYFGAGMAILGVALVVRKESR